MNENNQILNLIDNFLNEKNSFIFESVEKGAKGRYTIFGKNLIKFENLITINLLEFRIKKKFL